jgi:hypothetical protein
MSTKLAPIDFSASIVGDTGTIQLPQPKVLIDEKANLRLYNESGCSVELVYSNGETDYVPAGAWPIFEIEPVVTSIKWTITNILPNPQVTTMVPVYFYPGEQVHDTPALGNSPIGGSVGVTNPTTLANLGSPLLTRILDVNAQGDTINQHEVQLYNNGALLLGQEVTPILTNTLGAFISIFEKPGSNGLVLSGQTSGTATLYQPLRGDLKLVIVDLENYKNTGNQSIALPVSFQTVCWFFIPGTNGVVALLASGVAQSARIITAIALGGGTSNGSTSINQNSFGFFNGVWDTIQFQINSSAATGACIFLGV